LDHPGFLGHDEARTIPARRCSMEKRQKFTAEFKGEAVRR